LNQALGKSISAWQSLYEKRTDVGQKNGWWKTVWLSPMPAPVIPSFIHNALVWITKKSGDLNRLQIAAFLSRISLPASTGSGRW